MTQALCNKKKRKIKHIHMTAEMTICTTLFYGYIIV